MWIVGKTFVKNRGFFSNWDILSYMDVVDKAQLYQNETIPFSGKGCTRMEFFFLYATHVCTRTIPMNSFLFFFSRAKSPQHEAKRFRTSPLPLVTLPTSPLPDNIDFSCPVKSEHEEQMALISGVSTKFICSHHTAVHCVYHIMSSRQNNGIVCREALCFITITLQITNINSPVSWAEWKGCWIFDGTS